MLRTIEIGGFTSSQLLQQLKQQSISLNGYAEQLLTDDRFTTSTTKSIYTTAELTVSDLGFSHGANTEQIFEKAQTLGLERCPLELAPYLRMAYLDQPEGVTAHSVQQQAPSGSITIASSPLIEDDEFPKGFYLRRIDGVLWLRGYCADHLHIWNPTDHFIFCK